MNLKSDTILMQKFETDAYKGLQNISRNAYCENIYFNFFGLK